MVSLFGTGRPRGTIESPRWISGFYRPESWLYFEAPRPGLPQHLKPPPRGQVHAAVAATLLFLAVWAVYRPQAAPRLNQALNPRGGLRYLLKKKGRLPGSQNPPNTFKCGSHGGVLVMHACNCGASCCCWDRTEVCCSPLSMWRSCRYTQKLASACVSECASDYDK